MYVTKTGANRDSGTAYTTKELADEVVEHALAPLVYSPGPADGADPADWKLRPSTELLELKVCDPAVGSGAILVAACRYLADRLVEAWTVEGASEIQGDPDEVVIGARRAIADRCLHGVDRNPMAVEMAKLSLWLVTLSRERPFSFLDHALKAGDSLLGITNLDQLRALNLDPVVGRANVGLSLKSDAVDEAVARAVDLRQQLESISVVTVGDAEEKARMNSDADSALDALRTVADLVVGCALRAELPGQPRPEDQMAAASSIVAAALDSDEAPELREVALARLRERAQQALDAGRPDATPHRHPLHWPLAFPEVFVNRPRPGFDAMVGNPPFLGGQRITGAAGTDFRSYCVRWLASGQRGSADLVTYFFLRASQVCSGFGFLATNTISQGDTREVGLDRLIENGWTIHRAVKSVPWPGEATLEIAKVWVQRRWAGLSHLGGSQVSVITSSLEAVGRVAGNANRLAANSSRCFAGTAVVGLGFMLEPSEAQRMIAADHRYADVLFPYLNGEDLNSRPDHSASRWIINFFDWPLEGAERYSDCIEIVREKVKPQRDEVARTARRERWWQFAERAPALYEALTALRRVLVMARVSKTVAPAFVPQGMVYDIQLAVFAYDDDFHFGVLTSAFHWWWAVTRASTMRTDLRYTPTDCFETFPQPVWDAVVEAASKKLDEHRAALMIGNNEGLTKTYNRVHNSEDDSPGIAKLRDLHVALDLSVRDAYGWSDLGLDHGFQDTSQGCRFTLGPAARVEVLDRLLELIHQRYAKEIAEGLHARRPTRRHAIRNDDEQSLF
jgi:hypothetical protein